MQPGVLTHIRQLLPSIPRPSRKAVIVYGIIAAIVLGIALGVWIILRTQQSVRTIVLSSQSVLVASPLKIDFNQDIASGFEASIEPSVLGTWHEAKTLLGVSAVTFKPSGRFEAGRTYTLRITNLKRAITGAPIANVEQKFTTQTPPGIKSSTPARDAANVSTKTRFTIELTAANQGIRELTATLNPATPLRLITSDDHRYIWEPEQPLKQGTAYTFILDDARIAATDKRNLVTIPFTTVAQPGIASARTGGFFVPGQAADITFDQPMEPDVDKFVFYNLKGKGVWVDDRTYRYTPEGLKPGTTYNYTVKAGLRSRAGGVLETDRPYQFATNGAVGTASVSPLGTGHALNTPIRVAFDQAVDRVSAQSRFSISPAVAGTFSWSGNTMTFTPAGYAYQTTYSYNVASGVVPTWGLPSTKPLGGSFTTDYQVVRLNVPAYKAQYAMSCELSSTRMVLGYYGIATDDYGVLTRIGYNPRHRDTATNSWENPNLTYVGFLNGSANTNGYGVHAGPIAAAARTFGRDATAHFNVSAQFIASHIHAGRPVIWWGHSTPAKPDSWNTSSGVVQTWLSSHARVAVGVKGSPDAPVGFYVTDSMNGGTTYWTAAKMMANMNIIPGVSNQAVVVY